MEKPSYECPRPEASRHSGCEPTEHKSAKIDRNRTDEPLGLLNLSGFTQNAAQKFVVYPEARSLHEFVSIALSERRNLLPIVVLVERRQVKITDLSCVVAAEDQQEREIRDGVGVQGREKLLEVLNLLRILQNETFLKLIEGDEKPVGRNVTGRSFQEWQNLFLSSWRLLPNDPRLAQFFLQHSDRILVAAKSNDASVLPLELWQNPGLKQGTLAGAGKARQIQYPPRATRDPLQNIVVLIVGSPK